MSLTIVRYAAQHEEWLRFPKVCRQNKYGLGKELVILVFMMVERTFPSPFT